MASRRARHPAYTAGWHAGRPLAELRERLFQRPQNQNHKKHNVLETRNIHNLLSTYQINKLCISLESSHSALQAGMINQNK
jgi:hypothetical protein